MATKGFSGRELNVSEWGNDSDMTCINGTRSQAISHSNDYVDITSKDDKGWRNLLADPATRTLEITVSGITSDLDLLNAINPRLQEMPNPTPPPTTIEFKDPVEEEVIRVTFPLFTSTNTTKAYITGMWTITSFEMSGEHDGAFEFSVTFQSAGEITYTLET